MSSTKEDSPIARVQKSFQFLSTSASELNAVSDQLGKVASRIDSAFQKLNLGIEGWVEFYTYTAPSLHFWTRAVGYAKVGGKWGLAIRSASGHEEDNEYTDCEVWLFSNAPRALRIDAVDKIPELFDKLTTEVEATTKTVDKKAKLLEEWLSVISTDSVHTLKELGTGQVGKK
jgi:hypothetical protein